ncbi:MAG: hypothetical protein AM325_009305 [Candidatus Thorarchaeota archaeon SMTZ1-45]|nr:MAG: hypothetical protein AM325_10805 [Candidatus Thorarchaeota archaeon SMTZ1-45]
MKYREVYLITVGFIILGLGVALLNIGEESTFFIFPFFFTGPLAPVMMISTLFVIMMCFWWVNKNWVEDARYAQIDNSRLVYLRVNAVCRFCGNPLPENAVYCYSCGNSVEEQF